MSNMQAIILGAELPSSVCLGSARVHYIAAPHRAATACIICSRPASSRRVCWAAAQMQAHQEQVPMHEHAACTSSLPVLTAVPADVGRCCSMGSPVSV